jgi:Cu-processing system permease protein
MRASLNAAAAGVIARQELRIMLRNRWVLAYSAVFAVLTLAISYFGLTVIEFTGFQGFERTTASLLNLVLYLVPLASMLMGVQSFSVDGGVTDQLFCEPVTRAEIVLGKLAGMIAANVLAMLAGFGLAGLAIARSVGTAGLSHYLVLVGFSILTGMAFAALAAFLTIAMRRTARAYAVVLVAWFVLVLLFDLIVIGVSFLLPEGMANRTAFAATFLNPVDAARVGALLATGGKEVFGLAGTLLTRSLGGVPIAVGALVLALLGWIAVPTSGAILVLNKQDL